MPSRMKGKFKDIVPSLLGRPTFIPELRRMAAKYTENRSHCCAGCPRTKHRLVNPPATARHTRAFIRSGMMRSQIVIKSGEHSSADLGTRRPEQWLILSDLHLGLTLPSFRAKTNKTLVVVLLPRS